MDCTTNLPCAESGAESVSTHFHCIPALPEFLSIHNLVSFVSIEPIHVVNSREVGVEFGSVYTKPVPLLKHLLESNWSVSNVPPVQLQNPTPDIIMQQQHAINKIIINSDDIIYNTVIYLLFILFYFNHSPIFCVIKVITFFRHGGVIDNECYDNTNNCERNFIRRHLLYTSYFFFSLQ